MFQKVFDVVKEEAVRYHVPAAKIVGRGRQKTLVHARRAAVRRCRIELKMSYTELGEVFGGRDHTTMMNYVEND